MWREKQKTRVCCLYFAFELCLSIICLVLWAWPLFVCATYETRLGHIPQQQIIMNSSSEWHRTIIRTFSPNIVEILPRLNLLLHKFDWIQYKYIWIHYKSSNSVWKAVEMESTIRAFEVIIAICTIFLYYIQLWKIFFEYYIENNKKVLLNW